MEGLEAELLIELSRSFEVLDCQADRKRAEFHAWAPLVMRWFRALLRGARSPPWFRLSCFALPLAMRHAPACGSSRSPGAAIRLPRPGAGFPCSQGLPHRNPGLLAPE